MLCNLSHRTVREYKPRGLTELRVPECPSCLQCAIGLAEYSDISQFMVVDVGPLHVLALDITFV